MFSSTEKTGFQKTRSLTNNLFHAGEVTRELANGFVTLRLYVYDISSLAIRFYQKLSGIGYTT